MKRVLITGSNRGIGLEFVRQYLQDGWRVYATCRHPAEASELHRLGEVYSALSIHRLDITVLEDIIGIGQEMNGIPLDMLINNAGVYFKKTDTGLANIQYDEWRRTLEVNTLGTMHITETLLENVGLTDRDRLIVVITSPVSAIKGAEQAVNYYYQSSRAALNTVMLDLSVELKPQRIGVLLLHPGEVTTRVGIAGGISPRRSVRGMREVIENFSLAKSGAFINYEGRVLSACPREPCM